MEIVGEWTKEDAALLQALETQITKIRPVADDLATHAMTHGDEHALLEARACAANIQLCERYVEELRAKRGRSQGGSSNLVKGSVFIASLVAFACFRVFRSLST